MKTTRIPEQPRRSAARSLPPAGDWSVDTSRSAVTFSGRASRLAPTVRAAFGDVRGGLHLATDPNGSRVGVCVDVRSISTGNGVWDEMLRAADPFRSAKHPLAHYASSAVRWTGDGFDVLGVLSLAGGDTELALHADVTSNADDTVTLKAEGAIDLRRAGISLNVPGARMFLPRSMQLAIHVTALRAKAPQRRSGKGRFALAS